MISVTHGGHMLDTMTDIIASSKEIYMRLMTYDSCRPLLLQRCMGFYQTLFSGGN